MQIGRTDVLWNYAATFLKIAANVLLLPFILKMMNSEEVGIWTIFISVTSLVNLLDFGFTPSFTRNVTYIFSGVNSLKVEGFEIAPNHNYLINYALLKGIISAMKWFYLRMSIILFVILATGGTYYIYFILKKYSGDHNEIYIAWSLLCIINTYNLYTLYYDSLLQGKGLIKKSKQIIIIGQLLYFITTVMLVLLGFGLIAVITSQAISVIIIRILSFRAFFTKELKHILHITKVFSYKDILKSIYPNAIKIGLTSLGGFLVTRSAIFIGSLYLTLDEIASYGITMQIIAIITSIAGIYTVTYLPKITQLRVYQNNTAIKVLYLKGQIILFLIFIVGSICLIYLGEWALSLLGSQTHLLPFSILLIALIVAFLELNLSMAGNILLSKNEVPFFKASLISGCCIVIGMLLAFQYTNLGLLCMVLVPLIIDISYQAWKWPWEVIKELKITFKDYCIIFFGLLNIKTYE